ncbi:hypothetical protein LCGC14_0578970 [marine sediment metagenome]|uniref:Uncharacterized protein n=1 Tax=marine sediment metagenome TaxID=412755 RepID=A0A0F9UQ42_9ZZZZ
MLGLVSNYKSDEHTIVGGELSLWLNRLVADDRERKGKLFLVRYNELEVYVIAEWLGKPKDVFVDVLNIGKSLGNFTSAEARELRNRLFNPIGSEETKRSMTQTDRDYYSNLQEEDSIETERQELVARGE